jgi:hypothetical protein
VNQKLLIVVLIVLVLLFASGVALGATGGSGSGGIEIRDGEIVKPAWMGRIDAVVPRQQATMDDVVSANSADCLSGGRLTIAPNAQCWYTLTNARAPRTLALRVMAGTQMTANVVQPVRSDGAKMGSPVELGSGDSAEFDLFRRQSESDNVQLRIYCRDLEDACVLNIDGR